MKQIEITTNIYQTLNEVDKILVKQGFKIIRKSRVEDKYMSLEKESITEDNILDILSNSLLIRYLCVDGKEEYKKLTYKYKVYDQDIFISEEKINLGIDDTTAAERLLEQFGFEKIIDVNYNVIVYKKDNIELAFQDVEDLGLLVEYESKKDYTNISTKEIIKEKEKMLEELRNYNLEVSDDYDVKKAYQLIKNKGKGCKKC